MTNNNLLIEVFYIQKQKNLGTESKVIRVFPDFFVIKNGKNSQNFHFEIRKVIQNGKNGQNFHFEIKVPVFPLSPQ